MVKYWAQMPLNNQAVEAMVAMGVDMEQDPNGYNLPEYLLKERRHTMFSKYYAGKLCDYVDQVMEAPHLLSMSLKNMSNDNVASFLNRCSSKQIVKIMQTVHIPESKSGLFLDKFRGVSKYLFNNPQLVCENWFVMLSVNGGKTVDIMLTHKDSMDIEELCRFVFVVMREPEFEKWLTVETLEYLVDGMFELGENLLVEKLVGCLTDIFYYFVNKIQIEFSMFMKYIKIFNHHKCNKGITIDFLKQLKNIENCTFDEAKEIIGLKFKVDEINIVKGIDDKAKWLFSTFPKNIILEYISHNKIKSPSFLYLEFDFIDSTLDTFIEYVLRVPDPEWLYEFFSFTFDEPESNMQLIRVMKDAGVLKGLSKDVKSNYGKIMADCGVGIEELRGVLPDYMDYVKYSQLFFEPVKSNWCLICMEKEPTMVGYACSLHPIICKDCNKKETYKNRLKLSAECPVCRVTVKERYTTMMHLWSMKCNDNDSDMPMLESDNESDIFG